MSYRCKTLSIFGVTGSVGRSTMDVVLSAPERFDVQSVSANRNIKDLSEAARRLNADQAIIADKSLENKLAESLSDTNIKVLAGADAIEAAARQKVDLAVMAIMGFAGLRPIVSALENGVNVAIANKEPLVAAGEMIMGLAEKHKARVLPVDSEHNAIFQVFENENRKAIDKIILTASGGPFLKWSIEDIALATPEEAIRHPNWSMGEKISVDSASMMNKALEVIEAHYLFSMPAEKIEVLIHPQSVVHSMVSYIDGSILSQMGASDMRTPIAYALSYPTRMNSAGDKLDLSAMNSLTFQKPDFEQFPALKLAYKALGLGQQACIMLNAANEIAVSAFLKKEICFPDILSCVSYALGDLYETLSPAKPKTLEDIEQLDQTTRQSVKEYILRITQNSRKSISS